MNDLTESRRRLDGVTVCYVSSGGFGGVWRTYKQACTMRDAGARVVIAGWERCIPVEMRDAGFEVAGAKQRELNASTHPVWIIRVALNLSVHRVRNAIIKRRWDVPLVKAVVASAPDIVQAVDLISLECAYRASRELRSRLVYAAHELWMGFLKNPELSIAPDVAERLLRAEHRLVGHADLVSVVSDEMGARLVDCYRIAKPLTIRNSPAAKVERVSPVGSPVRLVFHGGLSSDRNVGGLIRAMVSLRGRATLDIHGKGRTVSIESLQSLVDQLSLRDVVRLHGPFEYPEVVDLIRQYDVGVMANRCVEENFEIALPNKVFDCMCAGLAIAMGESPAIRSLLEEVPYGVTLDTTSPQTIAGDLAALIDDPDRIMRMKQAAVDAAPRYWWPEEGRRLVSAFEDMLSGK